MIETDETFIWCGSELPVWSFEHWRDLEKFLDDLCPEEYVANIRPELQPPITGLVFKQDPLVVVNAVAAFRITDPEPEPE